MLAAVALCAPWAGVAQSAPATPPGQAHARAVPPPEERIDINHAGFDELMNIPGMTRTWAARIVRFRPYRTKADLLDRGVLNSEVYNRIKDYVVAHRDPR